MSRLRRLFQGGSDGNARLTAAAAVVLLVLLAAEGLTLLGGVGRLLTPHIFIGLLLIPPVVADVSMGNATYGDVLAGRASEDELAPFGGEPAHKAFALAVGLQLLVDALTPDDGFGAVLLVARPAADPVPALRALADGVRLPGDRSLC